MTDHSAAIVPAHSLGVRSCVRAAFSAWDARRALARDVACGEAHSELVGRLRSAIGSWARWMSHKHAPPSVWWVAVVVVIALGSARATEPESAPSVFAVRQARVFDGERVWPVADVVVQGGRIAAIGGNLVLPAGVPVIDGRGRTLLPGLIDAHTHGSGTARRDALRFGVTTELEMAGDWREIAAARRTRESLSPVSQADLWSAGTLATAPGGHGTQYGVPIPTLSQPGEADAFAKARLNEGSDYLKIVLEDGSAHGHQMPTLGTATMRSLIGSAHAANSLAVAHVSTHADAQRAIEAGIDGLVHVFMDRPATPGLVDLAHGKGTFVVATLSVFAGLASADAGRSLADDARLKPWLTNGQTNSLRTRFSSARWASNLSHAIENVRRLHAAGVPVLAGTDAGNPGTAHGASMHGELSLLVQAGLSPTQALAAATAGPARAFRLSDRGRIAPGMRADLLLVDGDPTRDITATRAIHTVWKNGAEVDRSVASSERLPAKATATAPQAPLIADFESGQIEVRYGQNWRITTDQLAGGRSSATQAWLAGGAGGSNGALRVQGDVAPGLPFAWAGTLFLPGEQPFDAIDYSAQKTLTFAVRSDHARELVVMLFSGAADQRQPAVVRVNATPQWSSIRIPLDQFQGADLGRLRGLAITAGVPAGAFAFEIDDVRIGID